MDLGLKERVALVCASSQGLGKAIATSLAQEGANVAICSRNPKTLEETRQVLEAETNAKIIGVVADLSLKQDIEQLLETLTLPALEGRGFLLQRGDLFNQAGARKNRGLLSTSVFSLRPRFRCAPPYLFKIHLTRYFLI